MLTKLILTLLAAAPHLVEDVAHEANAFAQAPGGVAKAQTVLESLGKVTEAVAGAVAAAK